MKIVYGLEEKNFELWRNLITIGNFDGIHRGHSIILKRLLGLANETGRKSIVVTFKPLPKMFLRKSNFKLITTLDEKFQIMEDYGIDGVCVLPFTERFSKIEPQEFLKKLWEYFHPEGIVVGYNHRFGRDGKGGVSLLEDFSREKDIELIVVKEVRVGDTTVCSSRIRVLISNGEIGRANEMLGRNFFFSGTVCRGNGVGKSLSFPTANLKIDSPQKILPEEGVYAARVSVNGANFGAMLYLGKKPTFYESADSICELYIMEFNENLYGKKLKVEVLKRIREDKKFNSAHKLKEQLSRDEETARKIFCNML